VLSEIWQFTSSATPLLIRNVWFIRFAIRQAGANAPSTVAKVISLLTVPVSWNVRLRGARRNGESTDECDLTHPQPVMRSTWPSPARRNRNRNQFPRAAAVIVRARKNRYRYCGGPLGGAPRRPRYIGDKRYPLGHRHSHRAQWLCPWELHDSVTQHVIAIIHQSNQKHILSLVKGSVVAVSLRQYQEI
jgi:hypothetical protein